MIGDERNFGILIAYIIPGWIGLLGLAYVYPLFQTWLSGSLETSPTVGGFLFSALASIALGTGFSTVRWLVLDPLVTLTLKPCPQPDFQQLRHSHEAMRLLIDSHYRYYQFHGNLIVASLIAVSCRWNAIGFSPQEGFGLAVVILILLAGARDTKSKYDQKTVQLLLFKDAQSNSTISTETKPIPPASETIKAEPVVSVPQPSTLVESSESPIERS